MKTLIPALLFSAAIPAVCQTTPQQTIDPNQFPQLQVPQLPRQFALTPLDSAKTKVFTFDGNLPMPRIVVAAPTPGLADPHMDEKIIHRPPQGTFAQQQPRTPLAGNLYPGLQLLPIETARLEPIPVYFPRVKVEPIPINALNARMIPVLTVKQSTAPKK